MTANFKNKGREMCGYEAVAGPLASQDCENVKLLVEVLQNMPDMGDACPVCHTYTHKAWCYYPRLVRAAGGLVGVELNDNDVKFLEVK